MTPGYWSDELAAFEKRTRQWQQRGRKVVNRFLDEERGSRNGMRLNLFHNHITTLTAMLYGSTPKVDVSRQHADPNDDLSRVAADIITRILDTDIESAGEDFASMLRGALQDRLLPGLGIARVRYEVDTEEVEVAAQFDMEGNVLVEAYTESRVVSERAPVDYIYWEDFAWGWARNWGEVPWVGFRTRLSKDEMTERFGPEAARRVQYKSTKPDIDTSTSEMADPTAKAEIWEIWCKKNRRVYWHQKNQDEFLDVKPDPLGLEGFWPCPPPMIANQTTKLLLPTPDYVMSQDLYNEIDILQTRIHMITKAVKVVGVYDQSSTGLKRMLSEGVENDMIPVDNWAMFAEKGGLQGQVDWFPVDQVAATLDRLRGIRNETIQLLYQVSGLQDMMQGGLGGGQPSSATEQALRARFASVRVQYLQDDFARFASTLESLKAEVISKHFEPETIARQSRIMQTANSDMAVPAIQLVKNFDEARWAVKIRPESIALIDYAQLKSERTEYLTALSTFLQSAQAAGKVAPEIAPMLLELLKWGLAGFKGSSEIEGVVDRAINSVIQKQMQAMQNPPEEQPDPALQKAQLDIEKQNLKFQQDMEKEMTKSNNEMQKLYANLEAEMQKLAAKTQGKIVEEAAQAEFNILEKKASGGRGEKG